MRHDKQSVMRLHRKVFKEDKVTIVPMGDEHFGSKQYDGELHKQNLDWILNTEGVYMIGMGDNMETATRQSVGAGVFEQDEIVQEQLEGIYEKYKPLADAGKILGLHIGNHEERVLNHSGLNLTKTLSKMLGVKYFGVGVLHMLRVGKQNYTMYTTHGHSGSKLPHTKIKACIDLANMVDVDVYAMGHVHQLSHHVRQFYRVNKANKQIDEASKHFILTGSYLNHWGSYAQEAAYEMMKKGSPKIKLSGLENQIRVSL